MSSTETISPHTYAQTGADTGGGPVDVKTLKVGPPVVAALINTRWVHRGETWKPLSKLRFSFTHQPLERKRGGKTWKVSA